MKFLLATKILSQPRTNVTIAIFPGNFDPVTHGHIDIATRAAELFDILIIAVVDESSYRSLFSVDERMSHLREALVHNENIIVRRYSGLTIDFARQEGAQVIVRGLRDVGEFEREAQLAHMGRRLEPDIDFLALMGAVEHTFVSSSLVKEVARLGGNVSSFVPAVVCEAMAHRLQA